MNETDKPTKVARTAYGGQLKDTRDFPSAFFAGDQIYFCSQACLRIFEQSPDAFMSGEIKHPKKED